MFGQLINQFDNLPENENTVAKFNAMFKTRLSGDHTALLEIGGIDIGERREVFINGNRELIDLKELRTIASRNQYQGKWLYEIRENDELVSTVNTCREASDFTRYDEKTFSGYIRRGVRKFDTITVNRIHNKDYTGGSKNGSY